MTSDDKDPEFSEDLPDQEQEEGDFIDLEAIGEEDGDFDTDTDADADVGELAADPGEGDEEGFDLEEKPGGGLKKLAAPLLVLVAAGGIGGYIVMNPGLIGGGKTPASPELPVAAVDPGTAYETETAANDINVPLPQPSVNVNETPRPPQEEAGFPDAFGDPADPAPGVTPQALLGVPEEQGGEEASDITAPIDPAPPVPPVAETLPAPVPIEEIPADSAAAQPPALDAFGEEPQPAPVTAPEAVAQAEPVAEPAPASEETKAAEAAAETAEVPAPAEIAETAKTVETTETVETTTEVKTAEAAAVPEIPAAGDDIVELHGSGEPPVPDMPVEIPVPAAPEAAEVTTTTTTTETTEAVVTEEFPEIGGHQTGDEGTGPGGAAGTADAPVKPGDAVAAADPASDVYYDGRWNPDMGPRKVDPVREPASKFVVVSKTGSAQGMEAQIVSANRALKLARYDAASEMFEDLYKKNPRDPRILMGRAVALQNTGRIESAILSYEELLAIDEDNAGALVNMLGLLRSQYPEVALRRLMDLHKRFPGSAAIAAQTGVTEADLGHTEEALRYLGIAMSLEPRNAQHAFNMAVVADRAGRKAEAVKLYEQALEIDSVYGGGRSIAREAVYDRLATLRR